MEMRGDEDEGEVTGHRSKRWTVFLLFFLTIATTFSATITLNNNQKTEFGQGVFAITACDGRISTSYVGGSSPNFTTKWAGGSEYIRQFIISGLNLGKCSGKMLTFKYFDDSGNQLIPYIRLVDTSTVTCTSPDSLYIYTAANGYNYGANNACNGDAGVSSWLSFLDITSYPSRTHTLNAQLTYADTITALSIRGRDDDDSSYGQNRRWWKVKLCPTDSSYNCLSGFPGVEKVFDWGANPLSYSTNLRYYPTLLNNVFTYGNYYTDKASRYWKISGVDWGKNVVSDADIANYSCGPNNACSQISEVEFYVGVPNVRVKVSVAYPYYPLIPYMYRGSEGWSAGAPCNTEPLFGVDACIDPTTKDVVVTFKYPYMKSADVKYMTVETSNY